MADLELPQPGGDTRHQTPVVVNRLGLELLFCVLGEPSFYQVVHLHGRIQQHTGMHFLFKGIRLPLQFHFQLRPGHARRRSKRPVHHHLTAPSVVAIGDSDAVGARAVFLHPLCYLCHPSTPLSAIPPGFIRPSCRQSHGRTGADTGPLSVQRSPPLWLHRKRERSNCGRSATPPMPFDRLSCQRQTPA